MNLQTELPKLIRHYEVKKTRFLLDLNDVLSKISHIKQKIEQLQKDEQTLFLILQNKRLKGEITLAILYEFQRNEAVIKRRIADIRVQIKNTLLEKETLEQSQQKIRCDLKSCNYKFEKYNVLHRKCTVERIQQHNFIEESLTEELIYGQTR